MVMRLHFEGSYNVFGEIDSRDTQEEYCEVLAS